MKLLFKMPPEPLEKLRRQRGLETRRFPLPLFRRAFAYSNESLVQEAMLQNMQEEEEEDEEGLDLDPADQGFGRYYRRLDSNTNDILPGGGALDCDCDAISWDEDEEENAEELDSRDQLFEPYYEQREH